MNEKLQYDYIEYINGEVWCTNEVGLYADVFTPEEDAHEFIRREMYYGTH